jgi:DNA-binding GntR family transcriptional regulator
MDTLSSEYSGVIEKSRLRDKVYLRLRHEIINNILCPGELLVTKDIEQRLRVSQTSVREALISLERDGLVESVPYKGFRICEFNAKHSREIYSVRAALEGLAIELITKSGDFSCLAELENITKKMAEAVHQNDREKLGELDFAFHQRMIIMAGNDILTSAWNTVAAYTFRSLVITNFKYPDIDAIYNTHSRYLEVIRSGNWRKAREEIEQTIIQFGEEMSKKIEDNPSLSINNTSNGQPD